MCAGIRATFQHHPADIRHPDLECLFLSTTFLSGVATTGNYASLISHGRGQGTAGSKLLAAAAAKSFLCRGAGTREGDNDGNCLSSDSIPHSHSLHHSSFLPTSGPTNITLKLWYRLLYGTMMNIWINLAYICYCIIALCTDVINSPRYISIFVVLGFICISSLWSRQHQHDCMTPPIRQIGGWRCDHVTRPGHCCVVSYTWP